MSETRYTIVSGTASDVYDLANILDVFLVEDLGWSRQYVLSSGTEIRDRIYYNNGGESGNTYDDMYARFSASGTVLYNYAYTYYSPTGTTYSGEIGGDQETANFGTTTSGFEYFFIGNKDLSWVIARNSTSGEYFSSAVGYCNSYYTPTLDSYPVCVIGHDNVDKGFDDNRCRMYDKDNLSSFYLSNDYSSILRYGSPQSRDSSYFGMPIVMSNNVAGKQELRGELRGIRQIYGADFVSGNTLVISGSVTTASGEYLVIKHGSSETNTFAYGPYTTTGG